MRQFGFDQVVPFTPLVSLHTREDIGIAYAYWEHLLRPEQQKKNYVIPLTPNATNPQYGGLFGGKHLYNHLFKFCKLSALVVLVVRCIMGT